MTNAQVHRGPIDESVDAARFQSRCLAFAAHAFALHVQFVSIASASGFLLLEELNQLLLADVDRGSPITLRTLHANFDELVQGFKFSDCAILLLSTGWKGIDLFRSGEGEGISPSPAHRTSGGGAD